MTDTQKPEEAARDLKRASQMLDAQPVPPEGRITWLYEVDEGEHLDVIGKADPGVAMCAAALAHSIGAAFVASRGAVVGAGGAGGTGGGVPPVLAIAQEANIAGYWRAVAESKERIAQGQAARASDFAARALDALTRAEQAEARIKAAIALLDEYAQDGAPFPTYARMRAALEG